MSHRFTDLSCKEVICICDGRRLGFVADVLIELPAGNICAIVVPGKSRLFPLLGQREDYVIPWNCICKVGPDIILVDIKPDSCRVPRSRPGFSL
ncbi:MAG: YlmC/YmxH family sporulation protein [Oscillospiraceae bacterium]|nr:YlmC/YmxH family sporulation protein [Oscillospiraceae bacterium]